MALEMCVPRLNEPVGDHSKSLNPSLKNILPHFLVAKPINEILYDYLVSSEVGTVNSFMRSFDGLLKSGVFRNKDELLREYMKLGKEYSELKKLIDWIDSEQKTEDENPDHLPGLTPEEKQLVIKFGKRQRIRRGTRLIREGTEGTKVFFLLSGAVDLFRKTPSGKKEHVCQLQQGHVFGEYGAFFQQPRTADVVTTLDCDIFVIDVEDLKNAHLYNGSVFDVLKERVFLFKNLQSETGLEPLPFPVIRKFFDDGEIVTYNKNEMIFKEGDWGSKMYFILDGDVQILKGDSIMRTLKRGDFFGEIGLLKKTRRSAGTRTANPCNLLEVDHVQFVRILSQNISVAMRIEKIINERIGRF